MSKKGGIDLSLNFFVVLLLVLAALSGLCLYAGGVSPAAGEWWATVALLTPVVVAMNAVLVVWCLVRCHWLAVLIPLAAIAMQWQYLAASWQFPRRGEPQLSHCDLRLATLNTHGFRYLGRQAVASDLIAYTLVREGADVVCMQEFSTSKEIPKESIAALFASQMPYFVSEGAQAIVSRFPILQSHYVRFEKSNNDCLWADLRCGDDTVRVISVHLQTSGFAALQHRFRKQYHADAPVESVLDALESNSRVRAAQVEQIRALIAATPHAVVVAGDFNDTPSSYTYRQIKGDLTDGFREAGQGFGATFRGIGGILRIDYILYNKALRSVDYRTLDEELSDHKAVVSDFVWNR